MVGSDTRPTRIFLVIAFVTPIVLLGVAYVLQLLNRSFAIERDLRHASALTSDVLQLQTDEETGLRAYLTTGGREEFLEPYRNAQRQFDGVLKQLDFTLEALPIAGAGRSVAELRRLHEHWLARYAIPILGRNPPGVHPSLIGKPLLDRFRAVDRDLSARLEQAGLTTDAQTQVAFARTVGLSFGAIMLVGVLIMGYGRRQSLLQSQLDRERRVAGTFQRAALPSSLPGGLGLVFDGVYIAARREARIGGDWYDAVRLADGRIVISIGDVTGSGLSAAVTMVSMRQVMRGVAQVYADPAAIIEAADRTLKTERPELMVSAFVGVLDPIERTLTYVSAGHPPPVLKTAEGNVLMLAGRGLPLGLRLHEEEPPQIAEIPADALIVFYTDGLTEATRDPIEGEELLRATLRNERIFRHAHPARAIYDAMLPRGTHDDVAILTIVAHGPPERPHRWTFDCSDEEAARTARRLYAGTLEAIGLTPEDRYTAELIFGELLGNVVRYASGVIDVELEVQAPNPVLHVLDRGRGFRLEPKLPSDLLSERGRGLFLIRSLAIDFNVTRRAGGGSHARSVLPAPRLGRSPRVPPAPAQETRETVEV
jgi:anti-sigma regulatory factor (Ser/Thr protein kinase)